ncbi:MAG TPA: HAD family hydrolase [Patescibacteria group bacterium]|nr:HAD family hydrolase [Patescibacteria group bacterium]
MFKIVFIDLDHTIFDTRRFVADTKKIFYAIGVKEDDFVHSYLFAIHGNKTGPVGYYDYTFKNHLTALQDLGYKFKKETEEELDQLFRNDYLFPDSLKFLDKMREVGKKIILVTAGNKVFQMKKLRSVGLQNFFDVIMIPHYEKQKAIIKILPRKTNALFINDSLRENKLIKETLPWLKVIAKVNPRTKIEEYKESGMPFFKTLTEISQYVRKID